jgi:glucosamine 6-phosphate synthetase-like amidotransferase/phosphosugar isomerase protein
MCGIFGIAFLKGHRVRDSKITKVILRKLFEESRVRGNDATGVAFSTDTDITVIKHNIHASKFIKTDFYEKAEKLHIDEASAELRIILGHTRLKTKGTPTDRNNNHPIVSDSIVGIHNGNISNDDNLFMEYVRAFPEVFKRKGLVDTEIIFRLVNHYKHHVRLQMWDAISSTNRLIKGSYACALIDASAPWMLWLFRDWSPTDVLHYPKYGLVIFASSKGFIQEATRGFDLGDPVEIEYDRESCLSVNTISNKLSVFSFNKGASNVN